MKILIHFTFFLSLILSFPAMSADEQQQNCFDERCTLPPAEKDLPYSFDKYYKSNINFGVVIDNNNYTIYRSSKMNEGRLEILYDHLRKNSLENPAYVVYMNRQGYGGYANYFFTDAIQEYEGSYKYGYKFFHPFDYNYRTYVDGHNPYFPGGDIDQKKYVNSDAIKYFGLKKDGKVDGGVDGFIRVMEMVLKPYQGPILFHCYGGRHRTGMVGMMIRYIQGGKWVDGPTVEKEVGGKVFHLNPAEYEYYRHNKSMMRKENIEFIREFVATEPIFKEWQQKYQALLNE